MNLNKYFKLTLKLFLGFLSFIFVLFFLVSKGLFGELPSIEQIKDPKKSVSSIIYSQDYEELGKIYYENRTELNYNQISPYVSNALVATEDFRFHEHCGIDFKGLASAFFRTFILQKPSGASTITQQLAKNLFHNAERRNIVIRLIQKIKEWDIAIELERNFSKEEIIALYLNTVPFLHNSFGIREASKTYFNKEPIDLKLEESAVLIGMLKGPAIYNPKSHPDNALIRRNIVLDLMAEHGYITKELAESTKKKPLVINYKLTSNNTGLAPHLREEIRLELDNLLDKYRKPDGNKYDIYADGLRIFTTIDSKMQAYAEKAVEEHMKTLQASFIREWGGRDPYKYGVKANPDLIKNAVKNSSYYKSLQSEGKNDDEIFQILSKKQSMRIFTWNGERDTMMSVIDSIKYFKKILQVGLCAIDPHTGEIRAYVGSSNFNYFKLDHVRESTKRQVGSTIKPFLYSLAIENNETPCSTVEYSKPLIPGFESWDPKGTKYFAEGSLVMLKDGLQVSDNRIAAQLIKKYGSGALIEKAKQLDINATFDKGPSIALGTTDISVIEMIGAYTPFMNHGIMSKPYYISRIEDSRGNVIYQNTSQSKEVYNERTATLMNLMMQQVTMGNGTAARLRSQYGLKMEIAAKTGTTQSNSDGWFIGSTPTLLTAVWVGADDPSITFASTGLGQGASSALPIWAKFYSKAYSDPSLKLNKLKSFTSSSDSTYIMEFNCIDAVMPDEENPDELPPVDKEE